MTGQNMINTVLIFSSRQVGLLLAPGTPKATLMPSFFQVFLLVASIARILAIHYFLPDIYAELNSQSILNLTMKYL